MMNSVELKPMNPMHSSSASNANVPGGISKSHESSSYSVHDESLKSFLDKVTDRTLRDFNQWLESTAVVENPDEKVKTDDMHNFGGENGKLLERNNSSYTYKIPSRNESDVKVRCTQFISNWVQTWNYLMITDGDYFECENPLFTACCNFYFHFKIMRMMSLLTLYIICLYLALMIADPLNASTWSGPFIANILFLGAYLWGASLYKGRLFGSTVTGDSTRLAREKIVILSKKRGEDIDEFIDVGSSVLVKSYEDGDWVRGIVVRVNDGDIGVNGSERTFDVQYLGSSAIETRVHAKFLRLREGGVQSEVGLFSCMAKEYFISLRLLIRSIGSYFFPVRGSVVREKSRRGSNNSGVNSSFEDSDELKETREFFCGCLEVPMVGGKRVEEGWPRQSTTSNNMADAIDRDFTMLKDEVLKFYLDEPMECGYWELLDWAHKYMRCFGKQGAGSRTDLNKGITRALTIIVAISPIIILPIYVNFYKSNVENYNIWGDSCHIDPSCKANFYFMMFTGMYMLLWLQSVLIFNALLTIFLGLLYGADAAHSLTKSWQTRFRGLRRIGRVQRMSDDPLLQVDSDLLRDLSVKPSSVANEDKDRDLERLMLLIPFIKRDAYERYLLIHHFVDALSTVWGGFLLSTIFFSLLCTGFTYYLLVISNNAGEAHSVFGFILGLGIATVLFIWPVWCLVQANTGVDVITESFKLTAPDDYFLLGDKNTWRTFSEEAPLYWCILGVPITQKVLRAYYSTVGTAAPVITAMMLNAEKFLPNNSAS